ncbi:MAG: hypothetical protein B6I35_02625 [Anaerolineaceae bacterium 4572_32.2]|nr:MAG: hypothetical protein B6I35_02625 [Anaerolineaceae bacterium 4572_32.2]
MDSMITTVWNETRGERVLGRARRCASFLCRLRGLTFRRSLDDDEGLLLVGRRESRADTAIHMFFVFFPIAAVWLDQSGRVVDAQLARPFRPLYVPRAPARDVLEGPPALLKRAQIGDQLRFGE